MEVKKRLYRSRKDKLLGGVCAGIADYFGLDPTLVRLGYILLTFCTVFSGIPAYLVMWIVIPKEPFVIE
ncbi:MAG: PspC domain-containing protein [Tannerellaceae bacterium]|nr:PspC domain-containing protein [Tannerellaceae bacterium]